MVLIEGVLCKKEIGWILQVLFAKISVEDRAQDLLDTVSIETAA